jgi:phosphoacetylglucosamine mutase
MITASHNQEADNGVKIIDPTGEMMCSSWEAHATLIANASNEADLRLALDDTIQDFTVDVKAPMTAKVIIARDTRPSGSLLMEAAVKGIKACGGSVTDLGVMTTPQLHFIVCCSNDQSYGEPCLEGYYQKLTRAFISSNQKNVSCKKYIPSVIIDCANGVGAQMMLPFKERIPSDLFNFTLVNDGDGILNEDCGADYVKLKQSPPLQVRDNFLTQTRYISFDGDADRIVYFVKDNSGSFRLLDGDKMATLICKYLQDMLKESQLLDQLSLKLIQTAYANGSSTRYAEEILGVSTDCVPTGVKHLHHRAKNFDVSVYFEANGHGTVLLSEKAVTLIRSSNSMSSNKLSFVIDLINQVCTDNTLENHIRGKGSLTVFSFDFLFDRP